jgi:hypothetical protein
MASSSSKVNEQDQWQHKSVIQNYSNTSEMWQQSNTVCNQCHRQIKQNDRFWKPTVTGAGTKKYWYNKCGSPHTEQA